ncbi:bifunctional folylpolyglutamate synthase/dihydrofolate synthase (plasmid) [Streptomyces clavuligerus]|nr:FolC bifunctional protein [Streptomyces clavuligerus]MBY6306566.1 bifunctional folylpolyglutamate synthase/dihydrofolate synthase [Streptomyces clavuligerus]QCS10829.1 bifunctional folylpolyglutamate synthase/dihydrofolate synthase [Streptomyces clavuligerus]QPJ98414.1 bifunctional folylpolyglutamate synthase/dihydrofolate synthase [Streptomyces clavuligerus]
MRQANVSRLLEALGRPERGLRGMLVVGTNGKGSTCAFAVSAVAAAGARVGSLPSPHLQEPRERIRIDGVPVTRAEYTAVFAEVWRVIEQHGLSVLAQGIFTTTAAVHFRRAGVRLAVAEASIGGSRAAAAELGLDVKVLTGIGLDHTRLLGSSLAQITQAKIEAVRDGDHVVLGRLAPEAATSAERVLKTRTGLSVWRMDHEIHYTARAVGRDGNHGPATLVDVTTPRAVHHDLPCPLPGPHQHHNLAVAIAAVDAMAERGYIREPDGEQLRARLAATSWPGRLELVPHARLGNWTGRVLLEGATNPQGVATVAPEILRHARDDGHSGPPVLVFAAMDDKDVSGMLTPLPSNWPLVLTRTDSHQAADPTTLHSRLSPARQGPCLTAADTPAALHRAAELAGPGGLIVVFGSLRLVGESRTALALQPV